MIPKSNLDEIEFLEKLVFDIRDVPGEIAEVGVYEGDTAEVIFNAMAKSKSSPLDWKAIHLFDTFEGFINEQILDGEPYKVGDLKSDYWTTYRKFEKFDNFKIYKGDIITTKDVVKDKMFSFVHLDVDIYKLTIACLEFFWPRISSGGIILIHDYCFTNWGIIKAVNEFVAKYSIELKRGPSRWAYVKK